MGKFKYPPSWTKETKEGKFECGFPSCTSKTWKTRRSVNFHFEVNHFDEVRDHCAEHPAKKRKLEVMLEDEEEVEEVEEKR